MPGCFEHAEELRAIAGCIKADWPREAQRLKRCASLLPLGLDHDWAGLGGREIAMKVVPISRRLQTLSVEIQAKYPNVTTDWGFLPKRMMGTDRAIAVVAGVVLLGVAMHE